MILAYIFNKCMPVALIIYFRTVLHRYYITRHVCFQYIFINYSKNRRHLGSALEERRKYISSALGRCQHRIFEILLKFIFSVEVYLRYQVPKFTPMLFAILSMLFSRFSKHMTVKYSVFWKPRAESWGAYRQDRNASL